MIQIIEHGLRSSDILLTLIRGTLPSDIFFFKPIYYRMYHIQLSLNVARLQDLSMAKSKYMTNPISRIPIPRKF